MTLRPITVVQLVSIWSQYVDFRRPQVAPSTVARDYAKITKRLTNMKIDTQPPISLPPGSAEAINKGCCCPVLSNHHGFGSGIKNDDGELLFWKSSACPIHGSSLNLAEKGHR